MSEVSTSANNYSQDFFNLVRMWKNMGYRMDKKTVDRIANIYNGDPAGFHELYQQWGYAANVYNGSNKNAKDILANMPTIAEQYQHNLDRMKNGLQPLYINDYGWNPTQYDEDTNEALAEWYKKNQSLPGSNEQDYFNTFVSSYKADKAQQQLKDYQAAYNESVANLNEQYKLAGRPSHDTAPITWSQDWAKYGYHYDLKDPEEIRRRDLGMPPKDFLWEYGTDEEDTARMLAGKLPKKLDPGYVPPREKWNWAMLENGVGGEVQASAPNGSLVLAANPPEKVTPDYGQGTVNLNTKPYVKTADGTADTDIFAMTMLKNDDGKDQYLLLPKVVSGKKVSDQEAVQHYLDTGEYYGKFATEDEAKQAAIDIYGKFYEDSLPFTTQYDEVLGGYVKRGKEGEEFKGYSVSDNPDFKSDTPEMKAMLADKDADKYVSAGESILPKSVEEYGKDILGWFKWYDKKDNRNPAKFAWDNAETILYGEALGAVDSGGMNVYTPYLLMTSGEYKTYEYLLGREGIDKAEEYFKSLQPQLDKRKAAKDQQYFYKFGKEHPVAGSILNIVATPFVGAAGAIDTVLQTGKNFITGDANKALDINGGGGGLRAIGNQQVLQAGITSDMSETGKYWADTGFSIANNVLSYALFGPSVAPIAMGVQAAGQAAYQTGQEGGTAWQGMLNAALQGGAEYLGEKLFVAPGFEKMLSQALKGTTKQILGQVARNVTLQMLGEGAQEAGTQVLQILSDLAVMRDKSQMGQYFANFLKEHPDKTNNDAFWATVGEALRQVMQAGMQGAISGLVLSGGATTINGVNAAIAQAQAQGGKTSVPTLDISQTAFPVTDAGPVLSVPTAVGSVAQTPSVPALSLVQVAQAQANAPSVPMLRAARAQTQQIALSPVEIALQKVANGQPATNAASRQAVKDAVAKVQSGKLTSQAQANAPSAPMLRAAGAQTQRPAQVGTVLPFAASKQSAVPDLRQQKPDNHTAASLRSLPGRAQSAGFAGPQNEGAQVPRKTPGGVGIDGANEAGRFTAQAGKAGGEGESIINAAAEGAGETPVTSSNEGFKSEFAKNIDGVLAKQGITLDSFNTLRLKDVATLSSTEKVTLKAIRESISMPDQNIMMEKVIPIGDIQKYLSGEYTRVGGYIARAEDVSHLKTYRDIYNSLRLDYPKSEYKFGVDKSLGIIKFRTPDSSRMVIPYNSEMGGTTTAEPPFTGNGFTKASNGQIIPEYIANERMTLSDGSELYEVRNDGVMELVGVFSEADGRFKPVN